jgi:hypothetical protein
MSSLSDLADQARPERVQFAGHGVDRTHGRVRGPVDLRL